VLALPARFLSAPGQAPALARSVARDQIEGLRPLSIWGVDRPVESERWIVIAASDQIQEAEKTFV
jgi:hypothetical protein